MRHDDFRTIDTEGAALIVASDEIDFVALNN